MKQKLLMVILTAFCFSQLSMAQEKGAKALPGKVKFTIDNCINKLQPDKVSKTAVGYQYWFIPQNFLPDGMTVKLSVVGPGKATHAPHRHAGDEIFYVLEGTAQFYLDGKTTTGGANTTFYCPENSEHGISNVGTTELKYLVMRKYLDGEK